MLKRPTARQTELEMVTLESLVPANHLLRKIDATIDFGFIRELTEGMYCPDNGRPPIAPEVLFKALFIGYLFGIRSERQLMRKIEVNVAYRWFFGLRLTDKVFDASTFSQNRRRRFDGTDIAQNIFDHIVEQAIAQGLVDGNVLYSDSTHLKASANKGRFDIELIAKSRADYWDALDEAVKADRASHGKKPRNPAPREPVIKATKVSRTDPDAGYMVRDGKPKGFFYLDHRTVDSKHNIIIDTHTTVGNVHDSIPYLGRLDRQKNRFDLDIKAAQMRKQPTARSWRMDETYIKVKGKWAYLYRAVDKHGKTLDFMLSQHRDKASARRFFRHAIKANGVPKRIVIDKSGANLAGLLRINVGLKFSRAHHRIEILRVKYLNNIVEQDHRFIKKITRPASGFKAFHSAAATLAGIEVAHMIRKQQLQSNHTSPFEQFASLAA